MSSASKTDLALFDLDHTLLDCDSNSQWLAFLTEKGVPEARETIRRNGDFRRRYVDGTLDILDYLQAQLRPLVGQPMARLLEWRREFASQRLARRISDKARELVAQHRERGDLLAIVTATNGFLAAAAAEIVEIRHVIASRPRIEGQMFTGDIEGVPCFGPRKLACLESWLATLGYSRRDFAQTWFYSDSANDLPLMSEMTRPVAVDPDERLRAHAERLGWPVISLR